MENQLGRTDIRVVEQFDILDSTKIKAFMQSPRAFFYSYVLGWRPDSANIHFAFGGAWHEAMEQLQLKGYTREGLKAAITKFYETYEEAYPHPESWEANRPKDPGSAMEALKIYIETYQKQDAEDKILYTEIDGAVPISQDNFIHYKLDTIVKRGTAYFAREHKTTGRMGKSWEEGWMTDFQVDTYNYVLHSLMPMLNELHGDGYNRGVVINGIGLYKSKAPVTQRVPVYKQKEAIEKYRFEANYYADSIKENMDMLSDASESDTIMNAFPCNTEGCSMYGGCKWKQFCNFHANPLQKLETPDGYRVEHWDPRGQGKTTLEVNDGKEVSDA